jgi:multiple sugar transport system permease protein
VRRGETLLGWALVAPTLILLGAFVVAPAVLDFPLSLMQYDLIAGSGRWVGLANYVTLAQDPIFWQAVGHTLQLALGTTVPMLVLAVILGLLLNRRLRGRAVYRTLLFAPYVVPLVASSIAWIWMLSAHGFVNYVLGAVLPLRNFAWLDSSAGALPAIMLMCGSSSDTTRYWC